MLSLRLALVLLALMLASGTTLPTYAQAATGPFVKQAFDLLIDRYVVPPSSSDLLNAGWAGGLEYAEKAGGAPPTATKPTFTGDRSADWNAFMAAYPALVSGLGASPSQHDLDRAIVTSMARSLNSSHTFHYPSFDPPGQAYGGVGIQMSRDLIVTDLFDGSPAEAVGLRRGDRLIAVDGVRVEGMTSNDVSPRVRGPVGSPVQLTVMRASQPEQLNLTVTRAEVSVPWARARVLNGGIGLMRITGFPALDAIGQFDEAMIRLDGTEVKAVAIDVRGNTGGVYATSAKVASRFIREGPISQCAPRQGQMRVTSADGSAWGRTVPIAILVDDQTGAGAEEVASALRENGLGHLVGKHTAGRFGGAVRHALQDGSFLNVTTYTCRSGKGQEIEGVGLEPDLPVDLDPGALAEGRDTQLEAALDYLKSKITP